MSTQVGIRLSLQGAQQTEAGLRRVASGVDQVGASATVVRGAVTRLAGAFAGIVSIREFAQAADAVTTLNNQLRLATGSAASASSAYSALFDIAQKSRVSFTELGGTFASITRATQEMGLSQRDMLKVTESIANAITVSGASASASNAALIQLSQGLASGVLRGEELNSVMEQTPRLAKALADGLNVPLGKLREMGKAGELTAEAVVGALRSQNAALASEVGQSTVTVGQAFTQLQNAAIDATGKLDDATGASSSLAKAIQGTAAAVQTLGDVLSQNADIIRTTLGALAGAGIAAGAATVAANIGKIRAAIVGLGAAAAANPVALAILGIGAAVGSGVANANSNEYEKLREHLAGVNRRLADTNLTEERRNILLQDRLHLEQQLSKFLKSNAGGGRGFVNPDVVTPARATSATSASAGKAAGKVKEIRDELSDAAKDYARIMDTFAVATRAAEAEALGLTKTQTKLRDIMAGPSWAQYSRQVQEQIIYMASLNEAADENAAAVVRRKQAEEESAQAQAAYNRNLAETVQAVIEEADAAEEKLRTYGLLESQVQELTLAKLEEQKTTFELTAEELKSIDLRIAAQKRLIAATKNGEARIASDKASEVADRAAKEAEETWRRSAERISDNITDALMRGFESGKGFAENLRDVVVNMFKTLILRPTIQAIMAPMAGGLTGLLSGGAQAAQGGGGIGSISSLASAGGAFGSLGAGASLGFQSLMAGNIGGALSGASAMAAGGGYMAALGTVAGALGPIALGVAALVSFAKSRGEKRSGGQYEGTRYLEGPSGGEIAGDATRAAIQTTQETVNDLLRRAGASTRIDTLYSGLESSKNGKGFAYAGARLSDGTLVGQDQEAGRRNRRGNLTPEQASAAFAEELKQVTLQTLQASDVPAELGAYLRSLGDIDRLTGGSLEAAYNRVNKIMTERMALEDQLFAMTANEADKLTRAREREREAIDATNRALLEQVYAQQDLQRASEAAAVIAQQRASLEDRLYDLTGSEVDKIARARERERQAIDATNQALLSQIYAQEDAKRVADQAADFKQTERDLQERLYGIFSGAMDSVAEEVRRLKGSGAYGTDPAKLQAQFAITTAQARGLDRNALERLPGLSQAIEAATLGRASSREEVDRVQERLRRSLSETLTLVSGQVGAPASTADVVSELKTANELIKEQMAENQAQALGLIKAVNKFNSIVSRWDVDGMPDVRVIA